MITRGVTFGSRYRDELFEYALLAEEQGLESFWAGEAWSQAAVPKLTQLLERTETIDICSGILNVYARTPGLVAMTANTLGDVGNGRFRLGLGTSGPGVIEGFHGVGFDQPMRRTREYVEIARALLSGERVNYDGDLFDLTGFALDVDEVHACPIYLAAMGETNRQLTGEFADGWMPLLVPHTGLESSLTAVERGADRGNRSLDDIDVAPWVPTCISTERPDEARDQVRSLVAFYVGAMGEYYSRVATSFGFGAEAEAIRAGWETDRLTGAKHAVTDEMLATFGACGTPADAAESIECYIEAGADSPIAYLPGQWADDSLLRETIRHLP